VDDHKQRRDAPHLLARLLGCFTVTMLRRRWKIDGGGGKLELGFWRLTEEARAAATGRSRGVGGFK
jgi:hypothetical protein